MAVATYNNVFLSNEIEDNFESHLDLQNFCNVDNNLVGEPGTERDINIYGATGEAEDVAEGQGNTQSISTTLKTAQYRIKTAQARFEYKDEEEMRDPVAVQTGATYLGTTLFNKVNKDIFSEMGNTPNQIITTNPDFDAFVDAVSLLDVADVNASAEDMQAQQLVGAYGIVHKNDLAKVRKSMKNELHYVSAFAVTGYVGHVAGVPLYVKANANQGTINIGLKEAVTLFNKTGVNLETITNGTRSAEDANIRKNTMFARKYYIAALTKPGKMARMVLTGGTATGVTNASGTGTAGQVVTLGNAATSVTSVLVTSQAGIVELLTADKYSLGKDANANKVTLVDSVPTTSTITVNYKYTA